VFLPLFNHFFGETGMNRQSTLIEKAFALLLVFASIPLRGAFSASAYLLRFSAVSFLAPIIATYFSVGFIALEVCGLVVAKTYGFVLFKTAGFPTLAGAYCWKFLTDERYSTAHRVSMSLITPFLCIALFCCHPVGMQAFWYSFYWFIPMVAFVMLHKTSSVSRMLLVALSSTFVTHAVGSIVYLYTIPTSPALWQMLVPVVIVERAVFAVGMTVLYYLLIPQIDSIAHYLDKKNVMRGA